MPMTFEDMKTAMQEAERTIRRGNQVASEVAHLLRYQLRASGLGHSTLKAFKKELENYNMHTGRWKD